MPLGAILRGVARGAASVLRSGGKVVGGVFGGPVGAAVGGIAGGVLGGAIEEALREPPRNTGIYPPDIRPPAPAPAPGTVTVRSPIPGLSAIPIPVGPQGQVYPPGYGPGGFIPGLPDVGDLIRGVAAAAGAPVPTAPASAAAAPDLPAVAQQVMLSRMMARQKGDGRAVLEALMSGSLNKGLIQAPTGVNTPRGIRYFSPPGFRTVQVLGKPYSVFKPLARSLGLLKKGSTCYITSADVRKARAAKALERKVKSLAKAVGVKTTRVIYKTKRKK